MKNVNAKNEPTYLFDGLEVWYKDPQYDPDAAQDSEDYEGVYRIRVRRLEEVCYNVERVTPAHDLPVWEFQIEGRGSAKFRTSEANSLVLNTEANLQAIKVRKELETKYQEALRKYRQAADKVINIRSDKLVRMGAL